MRDGHRSGLRHPGFDEDVLFAEATLPSALGNCHDFEQFLFEIRLQISAEPRTAFGVAGCSRLELFCLRRLAIADLVTVTHCPALPCGRALDTDTRSGVPKQNRCGRTALARSP